MQNLFRIVRGDEPATAAGKGRVAMIDARDIATVAVAALLGDGHAGKTYTLTGPEALSFDEVAKIVSQQTGMQIRHVEVPSEDPRSLASRGCARLVCQRHGHTAADAR